MSDPTHDQQDASASLAVRGEPPRIRFAGLRSSRGAVGRCRVEVVLHRVDGTPVHGTAEADPSAVSEQRATAGAVADALGRATSTGHRFEILGVKNVRAFDQTIVLVQVAVVAGHGPARLVGAAVGDADLLRATAVAVLNATNRILWSPVE